MASGNDYINAMPQRQPSPGLHILQRSAQEVAIEDSMEAEGKLLSEAEILAAERGIPSPGRLSGTNEHDLSSSANSTTIQAALISSQQMGGQPVVVSFPTATPKKGLSSSPSTQAQPDGSVGSAGRSSSSSGSGKPSRSPAASAALNSTAPANMSQWGTSGERSHPGAHPLADLGEGAQSRGGSPLHHTSPHVHSRGQQGQGQGHSLSAARSASPHVTINEKENTVSSPGPAASPGRKASPTHARAVPALKDAGAVSSALDDMVDVNALVRQARLKVSPHLGAESDSGGIEQRTSSVQNVKAAEQEPVVPESVRRAQENSKARTKAAYLRKRDAGGVSSSDKALPSDDGRSSITESSSGRSSAYSTSKSEIAKRLTASQEGGWAAKVTSSLTSLAGSKGLSAAHEALFLSMKQVKPVRSSGSSSARGPASASASSESKRGPGSPGSSTRYDSDDSPGRRGRPSSAASAKSSSGSSAAAAAASAGLTKLSSKDLRDISNRLTQPAKIEYSAQAKKLDPTLKYLLLEEAKECQRKPFKAKRWVESSRSTNDEEAKGSNGFTERMEAQERVRRQELEDEIAKADYDARLDRKVCPSCQAKQSYKEFKDRIFKCTVCNEEFQPRLTWAKVSRSFFKRGKAYEAQSKESQDNLLKQIVAESAVQIHKYNPKTGKVEAVVDAGAKARWNDSTSDQFFARMEEKLLLRENRLQHVEKTTLGATCTFRPHIARMKKAGAEDEEDEEEEEEGGTGADRAQAFMSRLEADMEERRKLHPEKYAKKHAKDAKSASKPVWN